VNAIVLFVGTRNYGGLMGLIRLPTSDGRNLAAGLDLPASILVMGTANQCVAGFRDRFHLALAGLMWILYWRKVFIKI